MRKKLKALIMVFVILQMVFGTLASAYAEGEEPTPDNGTPKVSVTSGTIYEVEQGVRNEVKINIKNLSSHVAGSVLVMPQINDADTPFTMVLDSLSNNVRDIYPNAGRDLTFIVDVDKGATAKTYTVDIKFTFFNAAGNNFENTSTIYLKVKNTTLDTNVEIEDIVVSPDGLEVGGEGNISFAIRNKGPLSLYGGTVSLTDIEVGTISVKGVGNIPVSSLPAGTKETYSISIVANSEMKEGSYPITISFKAKDENGKEYTYTQVYYVSVGSSTAGKKAELEIINLVEPTGTYNVNQNFNIAFDIINKGDAEAKNVTVVAAEFNETGNVVPKSSSVFSVETLPAGASVPVSFTFAPTGSASTRNYTIEFKVEYTKGGKTTTFSQYAGANVNNPKKDEEEDKTTSKPKIIVSQYKSDPLIVMAGSEFNLTMNFLNTHAEKAVKNVKMYLTLAEETSSDSKQTGNIFTPVDSSNTFYFDSIAAKGSVQKQIRLYTVPDAQPKTYTVKVNFEYEDVAGKEYTATELLGINVKQSTKVETSEIFVPQSAEVGMFNSVYFDIINTGKVDVTNLKVALEGDVDSTNKSTYIGKCATGESSYYEASFSVINEGKNAVRFIVSYDDPSGEKIEEVKEFFVEGTAPMPVGEFNPEDMAEAGGTGIFGNMDKKVIIGVGVGLLLVIIIVVIVLKKAKAKKIAKLIEAEEYDDEDLGIVETDDAKEGKDVNEQL